MKEIVLYAWVGEDERGSGRVGLKQGMTPAGMIPLAAMDYHLDRLARLTGGMEEQAKMFGKKIRLMKFVSTGDVVAETKAGS